MHACLLDSRLGSLSNLCGRRCSDVIHVTYLIVVIENTSMHMNLFWHPAPLFPKALFGCIVIIPSRTYLS